VKTRLAILLVLVLAACSGGVEPEGGATGPTASLDSTEAPAAGDGSTTATSEEGDMTCWSSPAQGAGGSISFADETEEYGLVSPLVGMHGHAAVWADFDQDNRLDLFVGTFAHRDAEHYQFRGAQGPSPDRLVRSGDSGFVVDQALPDMHTRTSGGAAGDFDGDGDLDLVVSRNYDDDRPDAPATQVLRNDGGSLVPIEGTGLPVDFGGRSVGVLDYDGDGLLDLYIAEDRWSGGQSALFRNVGGLQFEDVTQQVGLALDAHGLGVAVADLTGNGYQDIFVAGSNRLFVALGDGTFREADGSVFGWQFFDDEDDVAGVSMADVNRDGMLDMVVGQHFNSTVDDGQQVPVRLYLNLGTDEAGMPMFEDVTEAAGLVGLPTKAPHVELNDFDNDGWPDLLTTASAADGSRPAVFRHQGLVEGIPTFAAPDGLGSLQYWVAGPSADVDADGRLDVFLLEWEPALPSLLMINESPAGRWLQVSVGPDLMHGIGWRVEVFTAGGIGDPGSLIGVREITVTQGYSAGVAPVAHFGLGDVQAVDLLLVPPNGGTPTELTGVDADQHIRFPDGCG